MSLVDWLKRLLGISGVNTRRAEVISAIAEESTKESLALRHQLETYQTHADPFMALVADLHNKRTMAERR